MIERKLKSIVSGKIFSRKIIILLGAHQVGKTTLVRELLKDYDSNEVLWFNGDELDVQNIFSQISATRFRAIFGNKKIIVVDEAQRISDIGLRLKLIVDSFPQYQLIVTGSSSFELTNKLNEPLTGRKWEYQIFPLSFSELVDNHGLHEEKRLLPHRLIFGYYPEVVTNPGNELELLKGLSTSYLYKDILLIDQIKKAENLVMLLQALAFQIGSQVSYSELGQLCRLDGKTVEKYLQILENAYIIFRLGSFSRNLRNELKYSRKIYFYDNGIRNALINNFSQVENRMDTGALWENFIISERQKYLEYNNLWSSKWFWRTVQQKEIDYIEERDGKLSAYEFKWNPAGKIKPPKKFMETYPNASFQVIHKENIEDFILSE